MSAERALHILVVDDERIIADTLCMILKSVGYSTAAAYTGEEALEVAMLRAPDLLISDVIMPGIHGFDLAIRLQEKWPACEVLLFSGQAATVNLIESAKLQGHSYDLLAKPVHPTELLAHVKDLLNPSGSPGSNSPA